MSVNKNRPHVLVLPEDKANSDLANGFHEEVLPSRQNRMQVLPPAGGWIAVLELFGSEHVSEMRRREHRLMVLLIDFDGQVNRLNDAKARIPDDLRRRVFILGALTEPEELRADLGSYEAIGAAMAKDCREHRQRIEGIWQHKLLRHNTPELDRVLRRARPILFAPD